MVRGISGRHVGFVKHFDEVNGAVMDEPATAAVVNREWQRIHIEPHGNAELSAPCQYRTRCRGAREYYGTIRSGYRSPGEHAINVYLCTSQWVRDLS